MVVVFVPEHEGQLSVTDLGEALGWLHMQSADAGRTAEQNRA